MSLRALVLGGSGALGGAVCRALGASGARLAFTWHQGEAAVRSMASALPEAIALRVDASSVAELEAAVDQAADRLGGLDALVHCIGVAVVMECAGSDSRHLMGSATEADWDRLIAINAKSAFFAVRRAVPTCSAPAAAASC